jgi:hypothetical protein
MGPTQPTDEQIKAQKQEQADKDNTKDFFAELTTISVLEELKGHKIKAVLDDNYECDDDSIYHTAVFITDKGVVSYDKAGYSSRGELMWQAGIRVAYDREDGVSFLYWTPASYSPFSESAMKQLQDFVEAGGAKYGLLGYINVRKDEWEKEDAIIKAKAQVDELKKLKEQAKKLEGEIADREKAVTK